MNLDTNVELLETALITNPESAESFKAVPKVHLLKQNILRQIWSIFFFTKANEICKLDYSNKNMLNNVFHFSVSITELEFQLIGFLAYHFFITFIQKLIQMLILTLFSGILGSLTEKQTNKQQQQQKKTVNAAPFSIIKITISITFMHLRSKLTSEIH